MRIVCQRCAAVYAIDDRVIPARGVRAQCPKCGHQQPAKLDPADLPTEIDVAPLPAGGPQPGGRAAPEVDDALLGAGGGCTGCGKVLSDPFDAALGLCDGCRSGPGAARPAPERPVKEAPASRPPAVTRPPPATAALRSPAVVPGPARRRPRRRVWVVGSVAVVAVFAGVVVLRAAPFSFRRGAPSTLPAEVVAAVAEWQMGWVEVSGSAQEHLQAGHQLLRDDLPGSYAAAAEEFQKALVLDPHSDEAIAGFARAVALGHARVPDGVYRQALGLLQAAEARAQDTLRLSLARAHLLLSRPADPGSAQAARALAERVLEGTQDPRLRADAHLVIGRSWLPNSSALAVEAFSSALTLDPGLKVGLFLRALAHRGAADDAAALEDLEARLALDPGDFRSSLEVARVYRAVGKPEQARAVFEATLAERPDDGRAKLELAVLDYQAQGQLSRALQDLRELAAARDRFEDAEVFRVLTHLATAERLAGNQNAAVAAAQQALAVRGGGPAPHLQLFLVASERGLARDAAAHLEALGGMLEDAGQHKLLEGRLAALAHRWPEAASAYAEAATLDPRRTDARILAASAFAQAGQKDAALRHLVALAAADPLRSPPAAEDELLFWQPEKLLEGAAESLSALKEGADDLRPALYEAVVRYRQEDPRAATPLLDRVVAADAENALAQAWRALAALKQGELPLAKSSARKAAAVGRTQPLAHLALGAVLIRGGEWEQARKALRQAVELDRGLLGAEFLLAQVEAQQKDLPSARKRLSRIVSLDPSFQPARALLFALGKEKRP